MIRATAHAIIDAPAERVFEQVAEISRLQDWMPLHAGWPDGPPDNIEQGATFRQRLGHLGIYDTVHFTVLENAAPTTLVLNGEGNYGADARLTFTIQPTPDATTKIRAEVEILGKLLGPAARLAKLGLQRQLTRSMRELPDRLHLPSAT